MTNTDLADTIAFNAKAAIRRDERARKALAETVATGGFLDSYALKPVMEAQAGAMFWRQVVTRMAKVDAAKALASVREECTELLLERSESQSTCAITNETDRMQRAAARSFLRDTSRMTA